MNSLTLEYRDQELESSFKAQQFRGSYALHLSYTISLLLMFACGAAVEGWTLVFMS